MSQVPGAGAGVAQPPQGGIMERLFPKGEAQEGESFLDKIKDPLGKEKEKKEKERKKKIAELYGGGTAFEKIKDVESIVQNAPEKLPFGSILHNMRYHGLSNKPFDMINRRMESLKASCFSISGAPFSNYQGFMDL